MTASGAEPVLSFLMDSLEQEWAIVQPPNYWTTVRDARWPNFAPDEDEIDTLLSDSQEKHFVRLWGDSVGQNAFAEENTGQLFPFITVWTAYVVKESADLQRQMARATATMQALYLGNPGRNNPNYSGSNDWGLFTRQNGRQPIQWRFPKVAGAYGVGIVWGAWDIGYIHPYPKG